MAPKFLSSHLSRQVRLPGFTLVETLVAAAILVTVLGASTAGIRTLSNSSRTSEEQLQMQAIADETFSTFQLLRNGANANGKKLSDVLGFSPPYASTASVNGTFYLESDGSLRWCEASGGNGGCRGTQPLATLTGDDKLGKLFTDLNSADLVAMARGVNAGGGDVAQSHEIIDTTSFTPSGSSLTPSANSARWNFYTRKTTVTHYYLGDGSLSFALDEGTLVSNLPSLLTLRQGLYKVTVALQNYHDPAATYTATMTVSDALGRYSSSSQITPTP